MTKRGLGIVAAIALSGCASASYTSGPEVEPPTERLVVFQWSATNAIFVVPPRQFTLATPAPEVILNVSTPWTRGRTSLLTPRPRCPGAVTRLRSSGKVTRIPAAVDLAGSLPTPTLKVACFRI